MNWIQNLANERIISALGWTLIHSVWQIALIGILLKTGLFILRKTSAERKHLLILASLLSITVVSLITFGKIIQPTLSQNDLSTKSITIIQPGAQLEGYKPAPSESIGRDLISIDKIGQIINANLKFIVVLWLLGSLFFSLRFAGNFWYINRLRKRQIKKPVPEWTILMKRLNRQMKIKIKVHLFESMLVKVPMVIGHLKPVVLVPVGLMAALPYDQVEAILAHELAHIRRKDYLINIYKSLIEVVFFYHPVIWWISSSLETERENCCDDLTIQLCKSEKPLQQALLNLRQFEHSQGILATALFSKKYKLLNRIIRMKTNSQFKHGISGNLAVFLIILAGILIITTSSAFSPKMKDLPDEYKTEQVGIFTNDLLPSANAASPQLVQTPAYFREKPNPIIPDTTSGTGNLTTNKGNITMEFDGNYNLLSVKKDGKPLEGDEKKEYEEMAAHLKKLNDQEQQKEEQRIALEKAEKELQIAQEQIEKAQKEYEKAISVYHDSFAYSFDSTDTNVFVWTEGDSNPKTVHKIKIEKFPDPLEIPEIYSLKLSEKELSEALVEGMAEVNYDVQIDQLENGKKIIEIEKEFNDQKGANKIIVKTSGSDDLVPTLRRELAKDGILKDKDDNMSFSLSQDDLEVNGKKLSEDLHKKYLKIYKESTGNKLEGKFKIVIKD